MIRWGPVILVVVTACPQPPELMCIPKGQGGAFCVPDGGRAANLDVTLQIEDSCTSACDKGSASCAVVVDGGTITLAVSGQACFDPMTSCPAVCGIQKYSCALPPLADGTYTVASSGEVSQSLVVGAGGSPGCTLP